MPAHLQNEKRSIADVASPQQSTTKKAKLPPADSDLVALESAAKKPAARRLPATAPLIICLYKVTSKAGDIWSQFEGIHDAGLFQLQLEHGARPSALFDIRGSFNEFLAQAAQGNEGFPKSLDDLAKGGIRSASLRL